MIFRDPVELTGLKRPQKTFPEVQFGIPYASTL